MTPMKHLRRLLFLLLAAGTALQAAEDESSAMPAMPLRAATAAAFVPKGWTLETTVEADLNQDGRKDLALVIHEQMKDEARPKRRLLLLALRQKDGSLERSAVSDSAVLDSDEGGMMGDPFVSMEVRRGAVVIEHYGGSRFRWGTTARYRFQNSRWQMIGQTQVHFETMDDRYLERKDHNLVTGLVIRNFTPGLARNEYQSPHERRMLKHPEVRYWQLAVPLQDHPPALDLGESKSVWGTPALTLNQQAQISAHANRWKGPDDLSATLRAACTKDTLFIQAEVRDDQVVPEDKMRMTNLQGVVMTPKQTRRKSTQNGYLMELSWTKAQLRAGLGDDTPYWLDPKFSEKDEPLQAGELPVVIEITDVDAGQTRATLSTRPAGAPYAAGVLICDPEELVLQN